MRLKRLRAKRRLSQNALAQRARLSREYVARLELGQHDPSLSALVKLATGLKVRLSELLE